MACRFWYRASLVALLAGCAAANSLMPSGKGALAPALPDSLQNRSKAAVIIALPPIHPAGTPIDWSVNSLSSATKSAMVKIGSKKIGPIALKASNKHCISASAGLTCTLVVSIEPGTYSGVLVETYAPGVKQPLANGHTPKRQTVRFFHGRNRVDLDIGGIARTLKIVPATKTLTHGQFLFDELAVRSYDAAHLLIPTTNVFDPKGHPFGIIYQYSGFSTGTLSSSSSYYRCCGNTLAFPYDGLALGTETVTAIAASLPYHTSYPKLPQATVKLTVVAGNTDFAPLAFGIAVPGGSDESVPTIGQFVSTSSSSATPVRQFIDSYRFPVSESGRFFRWPLYGEDTSGNFWIGNVQLSNSLSVLGSVTLPSYVSYASARDYKGHLYAQGSQASSGGCPIYEFPRRYGALKPIREIDGPACGAQMAVDSAGNVYVADQFLVPVSGGSAEEYGVQEYPAKGSGHVAPIRTMIPPQTGLYEPGFIGLDIDDAENVYEATLTNNTRRSGQIYKFAPGQTTGTLQLDGLTVNGFAVDGTGDIYAVVHSPDVSMFSTVTVIQEFAPGAAAPMRTFSGTGNTSYGLPILLPRFSS